MTKLFVFIVRYGGHDGSETSVLRITTVTPLMLDMISVFEDCGLGYGSRFSSRDHGIVLYHAEVFKTYGYRVYESTESPFMCFFRWEPAQRKLKLVWRPAACKAAGIKFPPMLLADAVSLEE